MTGRAGALATPTGGVFLCILSGVMTALAMPGFGWDWLAFAAVAPLLMATVAATPKKAFLLGWLAGTVAFAIGMSWVAGTVHTFGGLPYPLAVPVMLLLALYLGAYVGVFAWGTAFVAQRGVPVVLAAPVLWVALEYLRSYLFTGLPWNLLGLAVYDYGRLIQIADLGGIYLVSWFVMTINGCVFALLSPLWAPGRGRRQSYYFNHGVILLLVPICVATYGQVRIASLSLFHQQNPNPDGPIRVALVQPNIPQSVKWDSRHLAETMARLERMTMDTLEHKPDLVIWPEASVPLVLDTSPRYMRRVGALARELDTHLMIGSLSTAPEDKVRNSVFLFDREGAVAGQVAKHHLVPFGEYVPLGKMLAFVRKLTAGIGDVAPGEPRALLPHPRGDVAVPVCYEVIFPNLVREAVAAGAAFVATVTNDAWFGASAAPEQHFATTVFRAVENRTYVVRAANTGISGMVDPYGLIQARTAMDTETVLHVDIDSRLPTPFYTTHGDRFAQASVIFTLLFFIRARMRRSYLERAARGGYDDGYPG